MSIEQPVNNLENTLEDLYQKAKGMMGTDLTREKFLELRKEIISQHSGKHTFTAGEDGFLEEKSYKN